MLLHRISQLLSLTLIVLLVCGCVNGDAECIPKQRSNLLDLKHGFVLPPDVLVSWKPGSNCCNWKGITCDPISGNVIGLDLSGHDITGGIDSDALFGLTSLQSLDLSNNRFDRISIPQPGFEKLKELRQLNLSRAGFAGQIPIGISHLTSLEYLDLSISYGDLLLEIPDFHTVIRNLSKLLVLVLDHLDLNLDVKWSTTLLTSAPQLQVLSLRYTNISGSLNKDVFQLQRLEYLDLSGNTISGVLPDFPKLTQLAHLDLSYNIIAGVIPSSIGSLAQLAHLDLSLNNIAGEIPFSIGRLIQLAHLDLSENNISGAIPSSIGKLFKLTVLSLRYNSLTGPIPDSVFSLPLLQGLVLGENYLSGELDVSVNASASLKAIDLSDNQLCGQIPPSFFTSHRLRNFSLNKTTLVEQ